MAKVTALAAIRSPECPKLQLRGVFSQKKRLWETIESMVPNSEGWKILDDVTGKTYDFLYRCLCSQLRSLGRASFLNKEGQRVFFAIETNMNSVRDWDTGDDGKARPNPAGGSDDDEKTG